jgi:nicotinamidase-related amidase
MPPWRHLLPVDPKGGTPVPSRELDLSRRALVVIDVQNEYFTGRLPIEYPGRSVSLANIGRAIDAAHAAGIPVVLVQQTSPADAPAFAAGSAGWRLHEAVAGRPHAHRVEKGLPGAFAGTDLDAWLRERGIGTLAIAGFMTQNCDDSTVRQAVHAGYAVEFLTDASGAVSYANRAGRASAEEIHRVFTVVMQSRFAAVLTTAAWIEALAGGAAPIRDSIVGSAAAARRGATP